MSARCAFQLRTGGTCEAKKTAPVHSRHHPSFHTYLDASKAGLRAKSEGRAAYEASEQHKTAYGAANASAACLAGMAGAPGECFGPLTPHHTLPRSQAGGLERADLFPVVLLCAHHNGAVQDDPATRAWATKNTFERNGVIWPFLMNAQTARRIEKAHPELFTAPAGKTP